MKSVSELNQDIIDKMRIIEEKYPELLKFIGEMPIKTAEKTDKVTTKNLMDYHESLDALIKKYVANHCTIYFEVAGNSN